MIQSSASGREIYPNNRNTQTLHRNANSKHGAGMTQGNLGTHGTREQVLESENEMSAQQTPMGK